MGSAESALKVVGSLRTIFDDRISDELAIMPDVAPSSLFGEQWMIDLVAKPEIVGLLTKLGAISPNQVDVTLLESAIAREDKPQESRGIFGETEQWIWAANRCLRKMHDTISNVLEAIDDKTHFGADRELLK